VSGGSIGIMVGIIMASVLAIMTEPPAEACSNVVAMSRDERIATVKEAEAALDEGDVLHARELARKVVLEREFELDPSVPAADGVVEHAERIASLSFVRDPDATDDERNRAVAVLDRQRKARAVPVPTLEADAAEALSRIDVPSSHAEAYAILEPLAKKDLLGSPNALGALVRLAKKRGDESTATQAMARCDGIVGSSGSRVCRGAYPSAPLVRGTTRSYLAPAVVALLALALRLLRSRRAARLGTDDRGRPLAAPWIGHAAVLQTLALAGAGLYVFARPSAPVWTTIVLGSALCFGLIAERRGFFAAVRRGKIAGLVVRPAGPDDAHLPRVDLYFGPRPEQTLEQVRGENAAEASYREAARKPILRIGLRRLALPVSLAVALAIAAAVALVLFALFASFF
jgi:hypothetical protein